MSDCLALHSPTRTHSQPVFLQTHTVCLSQINGKPNPSSHLLQLHQRSLSQQPAAIHPPAPKRAPHTIVSAIYISYELRREDLISYMGIRVPEDVDRGKHPWVHAGNHRCPPPTPPPQLHPLLGVFHHPLAPVSATALINRGQGDEEGFNLTAPAGWGGGGH